MLCAMYRILSNASGQHPPPRSWEGPGGTKGNQGDTNNHEKTIAGGTRGHPQGHKSIPESMEKHPRSPEGISKRSPGTRFGPKTRKHSKVNDFPPRRDPNITFVCKTIETVIFT